MQLYLSLARVRHSPIFLAAYRLAVTVVLMLLPPLIHLPHARHAYRLVVPAVEVQQQQQPLQQQQQQPLQQQQQQPLQQQQQQQVLPPRCAHPLV